jgi:molecular chaperone GrpE (heat shock protein)
MDETSTVLVELMSSIDAKVTALEDRFAPIAQQASRAIDERLRNGIIPILRCIDTIEDIRRERPDDRDSLLSAVASELESILESLDIERFNLSTRDPAKQRTLGVRPTDEPTLDGTIAESVRDGFLQGSHVIRAQHVFLYKFEGLES